MLLSLLTLFNPANNMAPALLSGLLFAFYPATYESSQLPEQPTAEQLVQAQHTIANAPACKATFTPLTDSSITLDDFGLSHLSNMSPVHFVNVWATWCAPCRAELPILVELGETIPASIDMLNLGDSPDIISKFAEQIDAPYELIGTPAPENILQTVNAQGLPYNAVFYGNQLIGTRNQAIHDGEQLGTCLVALHEVE
ncbi:hypothetical protein KRX19_02340 [Cardiobacteriaceae bacterium TAE3-ERU3]|nr:hypothetical protein [Cardiobacteriaceae bacterium TAE3-ERU3]